MIEKKMKATTKPPANTKASALEKIRAAKAKREKQKEEMFGKTEKAEFEVGDAYFVKLKSFGIGKNGRPYAVGAAWAKAEDGEIGPVEPREAWIPSTILARIDERNARVDQGLPRAGETHFEFVKGGVYYIELVALIPIAEYPEHPFQDWLIEFMGMDFPA
jgi:hypothetical protein